MAGLFRRPSNVSCFFCQSPCSLVRDPRNFRCSTCGCWNRYDEHGDIRSDEPAMHDESLNSKAFAKRASPSKTQLPTMYGKGPFCHTCQTNQMLLVNLLSNYLPPPNNPEYQRRLEMLPDYRESLHVRYPPVCDSCLPAVEDEIRRKDTMARTKALGGWLQESKGKEKQRRISETHKETEMIGAEMIAWRARGVLWIISLSIVFLGNFGATVGFRPLRGLYHMKPISPLIVLLSLLWSVWDPTYSAVRKAQRQGRDVRVRGRVYTSHKMQMTAWLSRLFTSCLMALAWYRPELDLLHILEPVSSRSRLYFALSLTLEFVILVTSCFVLRIQQPPAIRLLDSNSHRSLPSSMTPASRQSTPAPVTVAESDILAALTLSSKPIITNPVFGLPSLVPQSSSAAEEIDGDAMDWAPTGGSPPGTQSPNQPDDQGSWLRPQRFFAPEKPTGLEGLFERTLLVNDSDTHQKDVSRSQLHRNTATLTGKFWWCLFILPIIAVGYKIWEIRSRTLEFDTSINIDSL